MNKKALATLTATSALVLGVVMAQPVSAHQNGQGEISFGHGRGHFRKLDRNPEQLAAKFEELGLTEEEQQLLRDHHQEMSQDRLNHFQEHHEDHKEERLKWHQRLQEEFPDLWEKLEAWFESHRKR